MDAIAHIDAPLRHWLTSRLQEVEDGLATAVSSPVALADRTGHHLLAAGGKRFRPLVTLLVGASVSPTPPERLLDAAMACELLHLSTLYHDDVIDAASTRRGVPSVNATWGERLAVLAGDRLTALAFASAAAAGSETPGVLAGTYRRLVEGERHETLLLGRLDGGVAAYLDVVDGKTASLLAAAAHVGAAVADATSVRRQAAEAWGRTLGVAFQLADDLLDLTATADDTGKPVGNDLRLGVYTWPVLDAVEGHAGRHLRRVLAAPPPHPADVVEEAIDIVRTSGALERAEATVDRLLARADDHLAVLPDGGARHGLRELARSLVPSGTASAAVPSGAGASDTRSSGVVASGTVPVPEAATVAV
ncbi:polyprenyl synthetase family protein [Egicoccus halophilus]|uniref:Geranylgeranyl pyrophosphate synthase n=1 Tax=Egicoccus halophilus TaxID=1670830 RepID=A0A8J3ABV1_9ACTN|nr:polyprenyl synthetase family protein [Egicoccus halophilus]GGI04475.1 geranylgeranyl pyrophosphate synthase [Egicoccus halophilus]